MTTTDNIQANSNLTHEHLEYISQIDPNHVDLLLTLLEDMAFRDTEELSDALCDSNVPTETIIVMEHFLKWIELKPRK